MDPPYPSAFSPYLSAHFGFFQNVAEDALIGWVMSTISSALFIHLQIGNGIPAFLPIRACSLQLGLLRRDQEWLRYLSWDQSWQNLIGTEEEGLEQFLVSQHYVKPEEMLSLYYNKHH